MTDIHRGTICNFRTGEIVAQQPVATSEIVAWAFVRAVIKRLTGQPGRFIDDGTILAAGDLEGMVHRVGE